MVGNAPIPSHRLSSYKKGWSRRYHSPLDSDTDKIWSAHHRNPGQQRPEYHRVRLRVQSVSRVQLLLCAFSVLTVMFHLPIVSRKSGEMMPMFSTHGGISIARRKKAFPLLVFMVTRCPSVHIDSLVHCYPDAHALAPPRRYRNPSLHWLEIRVSPVFRVQDDVG